MDKELVDKDLSSETKLKIDFVNGKLQMTVFYDGAGVDANMGLSVSPDYFLDKLKAAIPGTIDDTVIDLLKAAFKV